MIATFTERQTAGALSWMRNVPLQSVPAARARGCAARKLDQYAAREVDHLRDVHSTCSETRTENSVPPLCFVTA